MISVSTLAKHKDYYVELSNCEIKRIHYSTYWYDDEGFILWWFVRVIKKEENPEYFL